MTSLEHLGRGSSIVSLAENQRQDFPNIIYVEGADTKDSRTILLATLAAANEAGIPVVADLDYDEASGMQMAVVRSSDSGKRALATQSALIHGTTSAVAREVDRQHLAAGTTDLEQQATTIACSLIGQLVGNRELFESFSDYYGGLRWSSDQERFVASLFEHSAVFDPDKVRQCLSGPEVAYLASTLEKGIPYDTRLGWYEMEPDAIFEAEPDLDYRRLADPDFRSSPEGQQLKKAYQKMLGYEAANQYKGTRERITDDGDMLPKPIIPLASFPVIEALMIDEVSLIKPKVKYDFGPSEVVDLILDSDSVEAQESLVAAINHRLPEEDRHIWDGLDEFQQKAHVIYTLIRAYKGSSKDLSRRAIFKEQLMSVLKAYSGDGEIAESIRQDVIDYKARNFSYQLTEVSEVQTIIAEILTATLASPDAESFVGYYLPDFEKVLATGIDPLSLSNDRLKLVILDALRRVDEDSLPSAFEHIGNKVFQDRSIGTRLREIVELRIQAAQMRQEPSVMLALRALRKSSFSLNGNSEKDKARQDFDEASSSADKIASIANQKLNSLLLDYIDQLIVAGEIPDTNWVNENLFSDLLERVIFGDIYEMTELPEIYYQLVRLAERPEVSDANRKHIAWYFANRFQYAHGDIAKRLVPVVIDIYRIMLGPVGELRLPSSDSSSGLRAATQIARHFGIFKYATEDELLTLARYKGELARMYESLLTGVLVPDDEVTGNTEEPIEGWQETIAKNIKDAADTMIGLEEQYREFLHIEDVKAKPNVYYPWVIDKLAPLWQKMRWEVGPGNRPSRDIQALHDVLRDHIENRLVIKDGEEEYPEDFDVFEDGHLDTLIIECFDRMVVPNDIKYNTTVWQDGLTFMHNVVSLMPEAVLEQFKSKYPTHTRLLEYLEKERARWNKE